MNFSVEKLISFEHGDSNFESQLQESLIKKIYRTIMTRETFIDDGSTSEVFFLKDNPKICIKVSDKARLEERVIDVSDFKPLDIEFDFLQRAYLANKTKVRIPKPYFYMNIKDKDTNNVTEIIAMERLRGVSLDDIYGGDYGLPENFIQEDYFSEIRKCLKHLHEDGIFHNDIGPSNLIVDLQDSTPGLIDFGQSTGPTETTYSDENVSIDNNELDFVDTHFIDNV